MLYQLYQLYPKLSQEKHLISTHQTMATTPRSAGELAHHLRQVAPQELGCGHGEITGRADLGKSMENPWDFPKGTSGHGWKSLVNSGTHMFDVASFF